MTALIQRHFVVLSLATAFLFILTGMLAMKQNRAVLSSPAVQQAASNISGYTLIKLMSWEIPALAETVQAGAERESTSFSSFLFQLTTGIYPNDLRSLLGRELPGLLTLEDARILVAGKGTGPADLYVESPAPPGTVIDVSQPPAIAGDKPKQGETALDEAPTPQPPAAGKKTVFIYHTHNRESWLTVSQPNPVTTAVEDPKKNITLVGRRLAQALNEKGVGAQVNTDDFYQKLLEEGKTYALSYAESLKAIQAATQRNRDLRYFFDLHRDSKPRKVTTTEIGGKTYARVLFIIGMRNKNHDKNAQFATELHQLLEKKYPGLSRGVVAKSENEGNGEYNQSVSPNSLLIEIGGIGNTIEECYNTADAIADVFADYYWQAERASTSTPAKPEKR